MVKVDFLKLQKLAGLKVKADKKTKLQSQLIEIIQYVGQLSNVDTTRVSDFANASGKQNVLAEDNTKNSQTLTQKQALQNAKKTKNGYTQVSQVITY